MRVTTPSSVSGFDSSYSFENAWCASAGRAIARSAVAMRLVITTCIYTSAFDAVVPSAQMKRSVAAFLCFLAFRAFAQQPNIDKFFDEFTTRWVRANPDLATSSRYFTGDEQEKLEHELTPETRAYREERIRLARE